MKGGTVLEIYGGLFNAAPNGTIPTVRFHCRADGNSSFAETRRRSRMLSPFYDTVEAPLTYPYVVPATILSEVRLMCVTPAVQCAGTFDVSVALNGYDFHSDAPPPAGSPPLQYVFYPSPELPSFHPLGGPVAGNTTVSILGRGFVVYNEKPSCQFGPGSDEYGNVTGLDPENQRVPGTAFNDELFVCRSPTRNRQGLVQVLVALNGFDFEPVGRVPFTYYREPVVSVLSPAGGPSVGGTHVEVRGSGFQSFPLGGVLTCMFGSIVVPSQNTTDLRSTCIAPPNLVGTKAVTISLNDQDYGSKVFFHYFDLPVLLSSIPRGGPPNRLSDSSTSVHVRGKGFLGFHGEPLCRFGCAVSPAVVQDDGNLVCRAPWPVDDYHLFLEDCAPQEHRLGCAYSACTQQGCRPSVTVQTLNISCVLDVWLEVSLNGADFTAQANVNYRYYQQPEFLKFGPSGGPRTGNTLLEVLSAPLGGFQRLNDGTLTLDIGGRRVVCENELGETVLEDDFDPLPPELQPNQEQMSKIRAYTVALQDVIDKNFDAYVFDRQLWEAGDGLASERLCGGLAQKDLISAVIDPGNEQGFGAKLINVTELSASLHFTGATGNALIGRHALSRSLDLSRGALVQLSVKRGEDKWPSPCEAPEVGDDLQLQFRSEAYSSGVSVPHWFERELWADIATFDPLDPALAGSKFVAVEQRINATRHILGMPKPPQNMLDCLRDRPCNSSTGKILLLQPNHGSGPYDVWAIDNFKVVANAGIVSDRRAVCRSPPADASVTSAGVSFALNGQQFSVAGAGNPAGQAKYIYYDPPVIEGIRPSGGPDGGGTIITLIGSGFQNFKDANYPPKCKFGIQTTPAIVTSDTEVKCPGVRDTVYTGFATVAVALNGVDFTPGPAQYIYYFQPLIYYLYPNSGPARGGTNMYVNGKGFIYLTPFPSTCKFTSIHEPALSIITPARYFNDTLLMCTTPNATTWLVCCFATEREREGPHGHA